MARSWLIGNSSDCDVIVNRPAISGLHCRLTRDGEMIVLEDLRSTDGTFVNGGPIDVPTRVTPGDAITLGSSTPLPWPAEAIPPGWQILQIGRTPENDFAVNLPMVSGAHARLIWNEGTREAIIEDLGSANGTAVGSPDRKASRSVVGATDTVYLGTHPIPASDLLARLAPPRRPSLTFRGREMILGRDSTCDHVIPLPMVSSRHARLTRSGSLTLIEDLGSANGTSVNGQRIDRAVAVKPGDIIGLGTYLLELIVEDAGAPEIKTDVVLSEPSSGVLETRGRFAHTPILLGVLAVLLVAVVAWIALRQPPRQPAEVVRKSDGDRDTSSQTDQAPPAPDEIKKPDRVPPHLDEPKKEPPKKQEAPPEPTPIPILLPPPDHVADIYDVEHLTPEQESTLGRELNALILRYHPRVDPGPLLQRLRAAEKPLIARKSRTVRYTYTILDSDEVNAFSHPGGYIYLSWGLFALIASGEELQFVLAHEMAHLERKHALHGLGAPKDNGGKGEAGRPAAGTAQQLYRQIAAGYTEDQEFEADDRALAELIQLGRTRRECLAFLRKYKDYAAERDFANGHNPPRSAAAAPAQDVANHFGAHPAPWERLERLEATVDRPRPGPSPAAPR